METQLKQELKKAQSSKTGYFARSAVLVGALTLGCGAVQTETPASRIQAAPVSQASAAPQKQEPGLAVNCRGVGTSLRAGQEIWFGLAWRAMYSVKVTGIDGERVTADVTVPTQPVPSVNIISVRVKFNSVELERSQVEPLVGSMCEQASLAMKMLESVGGLSEPSPRSRAKSQPAGNSALRNEGLDAMAKDSSQSIAALLGKEGGLENALGGLIAMRGGKSRTFEERAGYSVVGSDAQSISLRVKGGEADGQLFRLDRNADLSIEFLFEKAGYFMFPFKIEAISVDPMGRAAVKTSIDCARNVEMEVFTSEHAGGLYPACPRK